MRRRIVMSAPPSTPRLNTIMTRRMFNWGIRAALILFMMVGGPGLILAQDQPRPRVAVIIQPPATAPQPKLRGPLGAPAVPAPAPGAPGLAALTSLPPLRLPARTQLAIRPLSDTARCRTRCAQSRYMCNAAPDHGDDCDSTWETCTVGCGTSGYSRSPDLVVAPANAAYTPLREK